MPVNKPFAGSPFLSVKTSVRWKHIESGTLKDKNMNHKIISLKQTKLNNQHPDQQFNIPFLGHKLN